MKHWASAKLEYEGPLKRKEKNCRFDIRELQKSLQKGFFYQKNRHLGCTKAITFLLFNSIESNFLFKEFGT